MLRYISAALPNARSTAPVEMHVDAIAVVGRVVGHVGCEAKHAGKFLASLRIEIGVAYTAIDRSVSDASIRQPRRIIRTDRHVSCHVDHVVVDARVPT